MWKEDQLRMLIDKRKEANAYYHSLEPREKKFFWKELASKINLRFGTRYSGSTVSEKFQGLVRDFTVNKIFI